MSKPLELELKENLDFIKECKEKRQTQILGVQKALRSSNILPPRNLSLYVLTSRTSSSLPLPSMIVREPTM